MAEAVAPHPKLSRIERQPTPRQLPDGQWTSKLGPYKDITHSTPAALETSPPGTTIYGTVVNFMRRVRS